MNKTISSILILVFIVFLLPFEAHAGKPPAVKKSKSGICHPQGGTYYGRTKNYTPYPSMEACIKSGGRKSKR